MTTALGTTNEDANGEFEVYPYQLTTLIEAQPNLKYLVKAANDSPALHEAASDTLSVAPAEEDFVSKKYFGFRSRLR